MPNKVWKDAERRVGQMIGSTREGPTGETGFDVISDELGIGVEVKYRRKFPQWLWDFLEQAETSSCMDFKKLDPLVVLIEKGKGKRDFLCVVRFEDYLKLRRGKSDPEKVSDEQGKDPT